MSQATTASTPDKSAISDTTFAVWMRTGHNLAFLQASSPSIAQQLGLNVEFEHSSPADAKLLANVATAKKASSRPGI